MGTLDWTSRAASIGTVRHVADGELIHDPEFKMDVLMMTSLLRFT